MKLLRYSLLLPLLVVTLRATDAPDYFAQYASTPIPVINRTGGGEAKLFLVGEQEGDLIFRYQPNDRREIGVPLDTDDLLLYFPPNESLTDAVIDIDDGSYERAIEVMRPYVYPMVGYLTIPANKFNIHPYVERFAFALVENPGSEDEAAAFFRRVPLGKVSPEFNEHAINLVEKLVEQGKNSDALAILNKLPLTGANSILPRIIRFANKLRKEGNIEEALFLYQRAQDVKGAPEAKTATLWIAYCNVLLDRLETAKLFLEQAGEKKTSDPDFSLRQLILGRIQLTMGQTDKAMAEVSRGVVYTDVGTDWAPEIVYTSGFCYEQLGNPDAAREVYNEVVLFYPKTEWGKKSEERRAALPPPQPKPEPAGEEAS